MPEKPPQSSPPASPPASVLPFVPRIKPPDIIPLVLPAGECHGFSGASGAGKTGLVAWMLKRIQLEEPVFGCPTRRPAFTGIITADRTGGSHEKWFGLVSLELPHYSLVDDLNFSTVKLKKKSERILVLEECIAKLNPPRDSLLVIDPLALFLGGNLNDYDSCAINLIEINRMCLREAWTILGLLHAGKQTGDPKARYTRPQDRILGSGGGQTGHMGTTFYLAGEAETGEEWAEFTWAPHHAPARTIRLTRSAQDGLLRELEGVHPTSRERKRQEAALKVLELFPGLPETPDEPAPEVSSKDLIQLAEDALRMKRSWVMGALAQLAADGLIEQGSARGRWRRFRAPQA